MKPELLDGKGHQLFLLPSPSQEEEPRPGPPLLQICSSPLLTKKRSSPSRLARRASHREPVLSFRFHPIDCRVPSSLPPSPLCPLVVAVACTVVCPQPSDQLIHLLPKPSDFGDFDGWDHTDLRLHSLLCLLFEPQLPAPSGTPAPYRTGWW